MEENQDAVEVFVSMTTQWNYAGLGAIVGLNYQSLESVLRIFRVKNRSECFLKIQIMERYFLKKKTRKEGATVGQ